MGKIVKTILPIAVGIAVPFALPAIAPALAASPILTGAISGGLSSLVGGGNPLLGALTGGLGGAASQAFSSFGPGVFNPASPGAASALGSNPSFITGPEFFSTGTGVAGGPGFTAAASLSGPSLPGGLDSALGSSIDSSLGRSFTGGFVDDFTGFPTSAASTAGLSAPPVASSLASPAASLASPGFTPGTDFGFVDPGFVSPSATGASAGGGGIGDFLSGDIGKQLAQGGVKLLGGLLSEPPELADQQDALDRQRALAEAEFNANQEQLDRRNNVADEVINLSRSFDPEGAARRAAESRLIAASRLGREVDDTDRRSQAITRGIDTRAAASVPAAAAGAREVAQRQQIAGLTGGGGLIPTAFSGGRGFSSIGAAAADLERLRADLGERNARGVAGLFEGFFA